MIIAVPQTKKTPRVDPERKQYIFDSVGYKPHSEKQQQIHDSDARYKILACGRRYGKTTIGAHELLAALLDPTHVGIYWIVGPKYTNAAKEFRVIYNAVIQKLKLGSKVKKAFNEKQGDMWMTFPWGTELIVKSAQHTETLLGEGLSGVVMAEAARHTSETWQQYVRPALADERGWAWFTSTPRGYNWFEGLFRLGMPGGHPSYKSWRLPSWENPLVYPGGRHDPEIIEQEDNTSPQWFGQEIGAEFTAFAGKIYPDWNPDIHVKPIRYNPRWTNVWALDYGWSNPFVCLDVMIDPEDNFYVWREYTMSERATHEHANVLRHRADDPDDYHVDWAAGDPRGPDQATTIANIAGVEVYSEDIGEGNTHESWELGVEYMRRLIMIRKSTGKPKLYVDPSCTELIRQMDQLHKSEPKEGVNAPETQHKYDDHGPDALRYLVGQYFDGGAGSSLSDVYSPGVAPGATTEAQTFFQQNMTMDRNARF